jgi:hypothetical protein
MQDKAHQAFPPQQSRGGNIMRQVQAAIPANSADWQGTVMVAFVSMISATSMFTGLGKWRFSCNNALVTHASNDSSQQESIFFQQNTKLAANLSGSANC